MTSFGPEKLKQLQDFVALLKSNPQFLHHAELEFFKDYLLSLGARVPPATKPAAAPVEEDDDMPPLEEFEEPPPAVESDDEDEEVEEEVEKEEADPELMNPDEAPTTKDVDLEKEVSEENVEKAGDLKMRAVEAQNEGNIEEALKLFSESLEHNPKSVLTYAARANCYLQLKRPNAAIQDCNIAIKANPDSARAYKVRGKCFRFLGKYEEALHDTQLGNKLDFDDGSYELEKFLKARVAKRKEIADKKKKAEEARKARRAAKKSASSAGGFPGGFPGGAGGFPGGFPGGAGGFPGGMGGMPGGMGGMPAGMEGLFSDPDLLAAIQDPTIQGKLMRAMQGDMSVLSDPKIAKLVGKLQGMYGGQ